MSAFDLGAHGLIASPRRPAIPVGAQTVAGILEAAVARAPGREALVGRYARYGYAELDAAASRAAQALLELGVAPFDRVAASAGNHTELVIAFLGSQRIGAIWVGVNRALAPREKAYLLADSGARVLLGDRESCAEVEAYRGELTGLAHLIEAEPGDPGSDWAARLAAAEPKRPDLEIDAFAPAAIAYTSGTTGFPKGAVHSQHNLLLPGALAAAAGLRPELRLGVCLPLSILNLMILGPLLSFQVGGCCVLMDRIDATGIAGWVRDERIETFSAVPALLHDLLAHPEVTREDLATLTRPGVGGASCPESFKTLFEARFGYPVGVGYGLTEAPTAVTASDPGARPRPGSAGRARPHVEIQVLDESGRPVAPGELGEVCVGPAREGAWAGVYTPMLGYWSRPEATAEALRGDLLHTSDLGHLDADGELFIRDRKADLILRGGANVYPAEVERIVHEDPRVAACAVLGVPDPRLGERVVAAVELAPGAAVDAEELRARCAESLARYKVPERIVFVDSFPRTPMGKIRKRDLRELFEHE